MLLQSWSSLWQVSAPVPNLKLPEDNPAVVDDATFLNAKTRIGCNNRQIWLKLSEY